MRALLRAAAAIAIAASTSPAQPLRAAGTAVTCGKWLDARQRRVAVAYESYAAGVVEGILIGAGSGNARSAGSTPISLWIDAYCRSNPRESVDQAAARFARERYGGRLSSAAID